MRQICRSIAECIAEAEFVAVQPGDMVAVAVAGMRAKKTHCALVLDGEKLVGIFTERDYRDRVSLEGRLPSATPIADVMTPDPTRLRSSDCVSYAINRMAVLGVRNIPIVGAAGEPVSVLDVRLVLMHLIKVFAEIEQAPDRPPSEAEDAWIDIGGGD